MKRDRIHEAIFGRERWAAMPDGVDEKRVAEMRAKYVKRPSVRAFAKTLGLDLKEGDVIRLGERDWIIATKPKKKRKKKA